MARPYEHEPRHEEPVTLCPRCGLAAPGLVCPRCDSMKVDLGCSGECFTCLRPCRHKRPGVA